MKTKKKRIILLILILIIIGVVWKKTTQSYKQAESKNENKINTVVTQNTLENIEQTTQNIVENLENNVQNNISSEKEDNNSTVENKVDETESESSSNKNIKFDETVAFIGDSRTQGLIVYNGLKDIQDYSYVGLMVDTAVTKKFIKTSNGEKITLIQDMKNKNIKTVYIMLGVNELGWSYPEVFKVKYKELIDEIRKVKPNCNIYVQSILPVTKSRDQTDKIFNNNRIDMFNKLIKEVANEKKVTYLDVSNALADSNGYLPESVSPDGIHISKGYCEKWLTYLKNNS